jgi:hypothetical protein
LGYNWGQDREKLKQDFLSADERRKFNREETGDFSEEKKKKLHHEELEETRRKHEIHFIRKRKKRVETTNRTNRMNKILATEISLIAADNLKDEETDIILGKERRFETADGRR